MISREIHNEAATESRQKWWRRYGLTLAVYLLVSWMTEANVHTDTIGYADSILARRFNDFGHFLWFPLGWLGYKVLGPLSDWAVGPQPRIGVVWTLLALNWLAGLLGVFMMQGIVSRIVRRAWAANLATITFIFAQPFLLYSQTGTSYVPGLSLLLLGFWILIRRGEPSPGVRTGALAGLALAGSVSLWVPYVLGVPAALAAPLLIHGADRKRLRLALQAAVVFAATAALIFSLGAASLGIYSVAGLKAWVAESSHGATGNAGLPRMALGFARSFINLGNDGLLFKRFLVRDPFNPVTLLELVRLSLWKVALFYLFLASLLAALLWDPQGRRIFWLWLVNALPVLGFALLWQGGDIERYAALYPATFLALAFALGHDRSQTWFKAVSLVFIATVVISILSVTAKPVVARHQEKVVERISDLLPRLEPQSVVAIMVQQDEVWDFQWAYPLHPVNREGRLNTYHIIEPGSAQVPQWRQRFAARALAAWKGGGDVWVSQRLLSPRPHPAWYWAEGSDPNIAWAELPAFFSQLELGQSVGSEDGFALLLPSAKNGQTLIGLGQAFK